MSGHRVVSEQHATIVRVETDTGHFGWGEQCSFSPAYIPGHAAATQAVLPLLVTAILGSDPREVEKVHEMMDVAVVGHEYAKSALDIACWDLLGRATGLRVCELLGGARDEEVTLYKAVSLGGPAAMAKRAGEIYENGYRLLQVKVGDAWRDDLSRVMACVEAVPDIDRVVVDANGRLPGHEAIRLAGHLRNTDVYLEQPCATTRECQRGSPTVGQTHCAGRKPDRLPRPAERAQRRRNGRRPPEIVPLWRHNAASKGSRYLRGYGRGRLGRGLGRWRHRECGHLAPGRQYPTRASLRRFHPEQRGTRARGFSPCGPAERLRPSPTRARAGSGSRR